MMVKVNNEIHVQTPPLSKHIDILDLGAAAAETVTVPARGNFLVIKYTAGVLYYRADGDPAAGPGADITDGTGSEMVLQGDSYAVEPGTTISFYNDTACKVILSYRGAF